METDEQLTIGAESYNTVFTGNNPAPIKENVLLCFYHEFPAIDFFLKYGKKNFFIQVSTRDLSERNDFVDRVHKKLVKSENEMITPYELVDKCLRLGDAKNGLPKTDTIDYRDDVYFMFVTTQFTKPRQTTYPQNCNLVYVSGKDLENCFDAITAKAFLKAGIKGKGKI